MRNEESFLAEEKKREKRKLVVGTLLIILLLSTVFAVSCMQNRYYDRNKETEKVADVQGDLTQQYIESGKSQWQYWDQLGTLEEDGSGLSWKEAGYHAQGWKIAKGSFGSFYGELSDRVNGKNPSQLLNQYMDNGDVLPVYYFRTEFQVADVEKIAGLKGEIQFDDSIVIYLNGQKILTENVPAEGFEEETGYGAEEAVDRVWNRNFMISDVSALKNGLNCIAVEVHQIHKTSSDVYFNFLELDGVTKNEAAETLATDGLILQPGATAKELYVNWITESKGGFRVQFCKKSAAFRTYSEVEMEFTTVEDKCCYKAKLSKLATGQTYLYRIYDKGSGISSEIYEFKTPEKNEAVTFLFTGDPQIGHSGDAETDGKAWERTLEVGKQISPDAGVVIVPGDLADSTEKGPAMEEYSAFRQAETLKSVPVAVNKGNHDTAEDLYEEQFLTVESKASVDYSFVYGDVLIVSLNSNNNDYASHIAFLKKAIQNANTKWIVVSMHYSLFSGGPRAEDEKILRMRRNYAEVFSELGVDLVLSGHDHLYSRTYYMKGLENTKRESGKKEKGETLYLSATSSTGNKFYQAQNQKEDYVAFADTETNKAPLISTITFQEDFMNVQTVRTSDLKIFDEFTVMK